MFVVKVRLSHDEKFGFDRPNRSSELADGDGSTASGAASREDGAGLRRVGRYGPPLRFPRSRDMRRASRRPTEGLRFSVRHRDLALPDLTRWE
jgi:hypothetical protein